MFILGGLGTLATLLSKVLNEEVQRHLSGWLKAQARAGAAQTRGVVLRGEGGSDVERMRMCTRSGFGEHCDVPKTWS
jgi:hypothetical protein